LNSEKESDFMKFAVKTIMVAAFLGLLFAPVQAAELESGFMDTKWSTSAKDLKGFTKVGGSEKLAYYVNPQRKYTFFGNEASDHVVYGFYENILLLPAHRQAGQHMDFCHDVTMIGLIIEVYCCMKTFHFPSQLESLTSKGAT
jgi:hypothetical protein